MQKNIGLLIKQNCCVHIHVARLKNSRKYCKCCKSLCHQLQLYNTLSNVAPYINFIKPAILMNRNDRENIEQTKIFIIYSKM